MREDDPLAFLISCESMAIEGLPLSRRKVPPTTGLASYESGLPVRNSQPDQDLHGRGKEAGASRADL